jgi:hypothetical protein
MTSNDGFWISCLSAAFPEAWRDCRLPENICLLLDRAILENMPLQEEAILKASIALEGLLIVPGGKRRS